MFSKLFKKIPFFVLVIGIYPVLFLWSENFFEIDPSVVPQSLLVALVITGICFAISVLVFRSISKGSILAFIILALFFSYGHVYALFENKSFLGLFVLGHKYLLAIYFLIGIGITLIVKKLKDSTQIFNLLNIATISLFLFVVINIGINTIFWNPSVSNKNEKPNAIIAKEINSKKHNIYFIVLDGYSRNDLLLDNGFDNSDFLNKLKQIGFIIPACGQSNYNGTSATIASTLNMNYLDDLGIDPNLLFYKIHSRTLAPYIKNNPVRKKLSEYGYKFVSGETPYDFLNMPDADIYYPSRNLRSLRFQQLFLETTILLAPVEWIEQSQENKNKLPEFLMNVISPIEAESNLQAIFSNDYLLYQKNIVDLENLEKSTQFDGNLFVYSHLMITHKPYVFTKSGEYEQNDHDSYGSFVNQIIYGNSRILEIVNSIIKNSDNPPIIIIQGDHSTLSQGGNSTKNLQAYYLPDFPREDFDKYFTNLNIFRLIFHFYFNEDLTMLPNKSYILSFDNPINNKLQKPSCQSVTE